MKFQKTSVIHHILPAACGCNQAEQGSSRMDVGKFKMRGHSFRGSTRPKSYGSIIRAGGSGDEPRDRCSSGDLSLDSTVLLQSMDSLASELASKSIVHAFTRLPRQRNGLHITAGCLPENKEKNRYINVLPYDANRIVLQGKPDGTSYINASRMTLYLGSGEEAKHYIVTQGPLESTAADFWQLVFENMCHSIVMLTGLTEASATKCFKYWPDLNDCIEYNKLLVSNVREFNLSSRYFSRQPIVVREFSVINLDTQQELCVKHYQFIGWPDHGAPSKPNSFCDFLLETRREEEGSDPDSGSTDAPVLVHCSAGVGRSGVFVLTDLAASLIEAERGVYPLKLISFMRDQRMRMVDNEEQFAFACRCILKLFDRYSKRALKNTGERTNGVKASKF